MENKFLYRYISFETFVGMVQKQALTFVLPSVWEDSHEESPFHQLISKRNTAIEMAFFVAAHNKTYAQCWSELAESDAMWRIYAYNNRALRIKVKIDKIAQLDNVQAVPVTYSDTPFDCEIFDETALLSSLAYKRTAFIHEKEIRLINQYKYKDEKDAKQHITAILIQHGQQEHTKMLDDMFPDMEWEEKIENLLKLLNLGNNRMETKDISYSHIPEFVNGVMVHPLAPEWYVEVVQEFCKRNNIPFEGKSKLYS